MAMYASVSAHTFPSPVTRGTGKNGWQSGDREAGSGEGARGLLSYLGGGLPKGLNHLQPP